MEGPIIKSRLLIDGKTFIDLFFNSETKTISFALIKKEKRIFGIDKDSGRDWHKHPFKNPKKHVSCEEIRFGDFLKEVKKNKELFVKE